MKWTLSTSKGDARCAPKAEYKLGDVWYPTDIWKLRSILTCVNVQSHVRQSDVTWDSIPHWNARSNVGSGISLRSGVPWWDQVWQMLHSDLGKSIHSTSIHIARAIELRGDDEWRAYDVLECWQAQRDSVMNEEHMMCSNVGMCQKTVNNICIMRMRHVLTCKTHGLCYKSIVSDLHEATEMRLSHQIQCGHLILVWTPNEWREAPYSGTWVPSSRAKIWHVSSLTRRMKAQNMVRNTIHAIQSMIHIIFHAHWYECERLDGLKYILLCGLATWCC